MSNSDNSFLKKSNFYLENKEAVDAMISAGDKKIEQLIYDHLGLNQETDKNPFDKQAKLRKACIKRKMLDMVKDFIQQKAA